MSTDQRNNLLRQLPEVQEPFELFNIINGELEKLKSQSRNQHKGNITSKLLKSLATSKGDLPQGDELELSGTRLSNQLNDEHAQELSKILFHHPDDSKSRLELLEMFVRQSEHLELNVARDAYILALFEAETNLLSTHKINAAVITQNIYLKKLFGYLSSDYALAQEKMDESGDDVVLKQQAQKMQSGVSFVRGCFTLLKSEPIQHKFELNLHDARGSSSIDFEEIKKGYDPMLRRLNLIPPAQQNRELMLDILHRLEKKNPLVGYHESKMHEILAQIKLAASLASKETGIQKVGFELLSKAMKAISLAVDMVGNAPEKSIEVAIIHRYGQLCYTIQHSLKTHGVQITNEHKDRMRKAVNLMEPITDDPKVKSMQSKLLRILSEM